MAHFTLLSVYIYKDILALFASKPYTKPTSKNQDLTSHLTNTCLQSETNNVHLLSTLKESGLDIEKIEFQVNDIVRKTFKAATKQVIDFQVKKNCWEIFGIDVLIDDNHQTWLLEINAVSYLIFTHTHILKKNTHDDNEFFNFFTIWVFFGGGMEQYTQCPDFAQTGDILAKTIEGLFEGALEIAVKPFFNGNTDEELKGWKDDGIELRFGFRKCLELDLLGGVA